MPQNRGIFYKVTGSKIGGFGENAGYCCSYNGRCVNKKVATKFGSNVATYYLCVATMKREHNIIVRSNTPEGQRSHFIERLFERYGIKISEKEYDELCVPYKIFHGAFSKNRRKTVGWIYVKGEKVWVLRDGELQRLATVYPPSVEFSDTEMIRSCFGGAARAAAMTIYRAYKRESNVVSKMKFDSIKDAALYFFSKTRFAPLHIDKYKHGSARTIKVSVIINKILCGTSEHTELVVRRKKSIIK